MTGNSDKLLKKANRKKNKDGYDIKIWAGIAKSV
jgi:hypothetical protein